MVSRATAYAPKVLLLAAAVGGAVAFVAAVPSGCTGGECSYDEEESQLPVTSINCPAGDRCYLGQCFRGCNSGMERNESCASDGDCKKAERPHCVFFDAIAGSFCSTCEEGETCVVGLNICQAIAEIPDPDEPGISNDPPPPLPLDGGPITPVTWDRDAGETMAPAQPTHVGYFSLVARVDARNGFFVSTIAEASFCSVGTASTAIIARDETYLVQSDPCEIHETLRIRPADITPADVGSIHFRADSNTPNALRNIPDPVMIGISYDFDEVTRRYVMSPMPLPADIFTFSELPQSKSQYVRLTGDALQGVVGPWPVIPQERSRLNPYRFDLQPETRDLLTNPIRVSRSNSGDLSFGWEILTGNANESARVLLEIGGIRSPCENVNGLRTEELVLRCDHADDNPLQAGEVLVKKDILDEYLARTGAAVGTTLTVRFGRMQRAQLSYDTAINGVLYFGHEYQGEIVIDP